MRSLILCAEICACSVQPRHPYPVRRIVDATTLEIVIEGQVVRVRLLHVGAPRATSEAAARQALANLIARAGVTLEIEGPAFDSQGRLQAYAFAGQRNLSVELVRSGFCRYDKAGGPGRFASVFALAEADARRAARAGH